MGCSPSKLDHLEDSVHVMIRRENKNTKRGTAKRHQVARTTTEEESGSLNEDELDTSFSRRRTGQASQAGFFSSRRQQPNEMRMLAWGIQVLQRPAMVLVAMREFFCMV